MVGLGQGAVVSEAVSGPTQGGADLLGEGFFQELAEGGSQVGFGFGLVPEALASPGQVHLQASEVGASLRGPGKSTPSDLVSVLPEGQEEVHEVGDLGRSGGHGRRPGAFESLVHLERFVENTLVLSYRNKRRKCKRTPP